MRRPELFPALCLVALTSIAPACGLLGDDAEGETDAAATAGSEKATGADADPTAAADGSPAADNGAGELIVDDAPDGIDRYKRWSPSHPLLNASVVGGASVGGASAIVVTRDDHVGITGDGGNNWSFSKHTHGYVLAAAGYEGGPYVVVGMGGYAAISDDGRTWRDLHRYTSSNLIGVVASSQGIVAIGHRGEFVKYARDGSSAATGFFPDKFKPKAVTELDGAVVAYAGKKAYGTADGVTWTRMESAPNLPSSAVSLTSAGVCKIGKVGKQKGVICAVKGTAHGLGQGVAAVDDKGTVALTRDGGSSWTTSRLPFKGANAIFGAGPFYAVGSKGSVAKSTDGSSWVDQEWDESAGLNAGLIDGSTVIIVGDGGTVIVSKDGGTKWDYAETPTGGSLKSIVKAGGKYLTTDGRTVLASTDAMTWLEDLATEPALPSTGASCETLPAPGDRCKFYADRTTPEGIPNVRAFSFKGNTGLAMGDSALVAFSQDGGTNWNVKTGLNLGFVSMFDVLGQVVVASNGTRIVVSNDAGSTWLEGRLPKKYKFSDVRVGGNGNVYAVGTAGTVLVAGANHDIFLPAQVGDKNKIKYTRIFDVAGVIYIAGAKGELWRSTDGASFAPVVTGTTSMIQAMTGEGNTVVAVTVAGRRNGNFLLRSEDGGAHFYSAGEMTDWGAVPRSDLKLEGGKLSYKDRVSSDLGRSWTREVENYWSGAVADDQGLYLLNRSMSYAKDKLYVITGSGDNDWVLLSDVYSEGGGVLCDPSSGCWMRAGGTVYRPG